MNTPTSLGLTLTIHRGSKQIGGSCVELTHAGHSIIIDAGMPLDGVIPLKPPTFQAPIAAVLISHAHQDHWGLLNEIPADVPVYASPGACALLNEVDFVFLPHHPKQHIQALTSMRSFVIAGFSITPYRVDHSSPDALAFVIEAGGKRVFYSGDLRATGRTKYRFDSLLENPPAQIDALLLEGTSLGRKAVPAYPDEASVEQGFIQAFKEQRNLSIIFASAQNLDRVVTIFRAAKQTNKTLIIDPYTAFVLDRLSILSHSIPQLMWDGIRVLCWQDQMKKLERHGLHEFAGQCRGKRIAIRSLGDRASDFVLMGRAFLVPQVIRALGGHEGVRLYWSYWEGYLGRPEQAQLIEIANKSGHPIKVVHSSGHASADDLDRLVKAIRPRMLVPIHTQHPQRYEEIGMKPTVVSDSSKLEIT